MGNAYGQMDLSKYISHDSLKPENMTSYIARNAQGLMVVENIFPVETCKDSFTWFEEVDTSRFEDARAVAEGAPPHFNAAEFSKKTDSPKRYSEGAYISEDQLKFGYENINMLTENLDRITKKLVLKVERDILAELQDTTTYTDINTVNGSNWNAPATATPIDDILDGIYAIEADEAETPTDLILGVSDYYNLIACDQVWQSKMYTENMVEGTNTFIKRINSMPIAVTNAVYYTGGTRTAVLAAQGILLNRQAAKKFVDVDYATARGLDEKVTPSQIWIKGTRNLKIKVLKPKFLCLLQSLTS